MKNLFSPDESDAAAIDQAADEITELVSEIKEQVKQNKYGGKGSAPLTQMADQPGRRYSWVETDAEREARLAAWAKEGKL